MAFKISILTLFPEEFPGLLGSSVLGRALKDGLWELEVIDIRSFATDKHKTVDDTPYGGGAGMVMRADIVGQAIEKARQTNPGPVVYLTPTGQTFNHSLSTNLAEKDGLILLCGHYEGIDQRVLDTMVDKEISIGDYVLSGGEVAAMVVADSVLRHIPSVLGAKESLSEESFNVAGEKLLEYPHYTRPAEWNGQKVPEVLTSGNHGEIDKWRKQKARERTKERRPDLLKNNN